MALEAGVPVIPVAMINTFDIQPPGQVVPRIMRVGIRIGKPLDFSRYAGMEGDRFVLRSITDEIMYELMQLSGQEYVDHYATKAKADAADRAAAQRAVIDQPYGGSERRHDPARSARPASRCRDAGRGCGAQSRQHSGSIRRAASAPRSSRCRPRRRARDRGRVVVAEAASRRANLVRAGRRSSGSSASGRAAEEDVVHVEQPGPAPGSGRCGRRRAGRRTTSLPP